ncbi:NAD-dependent protein deacylase [Periweissella cryptocerci]|uniref:protein acetyllysine N-acetyltransferase n=1 Tax=Periweissella cryptocerci TaxID=2506420 RepID=A0A4P6YUN6_9LACO|nr:NAD-dependent protein deacylase [Periweissella cryptocerci]QBO36436.1 NAD-dependent protein deacylase [Periweissella cryptocerci]
MFMDKKIQDLFNNAKNIVFLTGAGVSTASGIPDYRSKGGLYDAVERPEYLLSTDALANEPAKMYDFIIKNMYFPATKPNVIHQKMAALVNAGKARIITQNVDGLHLKAGADAERVIEYHGNIYDVYGVTDHQPASYQNYQAGMRREDGDILRPNITLYGEIPFRTNEAAQWVMNADLVVIVGTSFVVYPFAGLLQYANAQVPILAVNRERIEAPQYVQQEIGDAVTFFEQLTVE